MIVSSMMKVGLLWYDDDKERTLEEKVRRAVDHYRQKYDESPTLCLVNPSLVDHSGGDVSGQGHRMVDAIELRTAHNVLPHHFWIGVAEAGNGKGRACSRGA